MKKLLLVMVILTGFVVSGYSEDLAEVAKKEKARREALAKEGKKPNKVYTNKDIPNIQSSLGIEVQNPEAYAEPVESEGIADTTEGTEPTEATDVTEAPEAEETTMAETMSDTETEESSVPVDIEELKRQKEEIDREIQEKTKVVNQAVQSRSIGDQYRELREAEEKSAELEIKIREMEQNQETEGEDEE